MELEETTEENVNETFPELEEETNGLDNNKDPLLIEGENEYSIDDEDNKDEDDASMP